MADSAADALVRFELFRGLAPEELAALRGRWEQRHLPSQASVLATGQQSDFVYLVEQGTVKVYLDKPNGGLLTLNILGEGEVLGEVGALEEQPSSANVVTLEPCRMLAMERAAFRQCLQTMPMLGFNLLRVVARRLRWNGEHLAEITDLSIPSRVACQLLIFARRYGPPDATEEKAAPVTIPLRLTHDEIGDLVDASRGPVNAAMRAFRKAGFIEEDVRRHRVTVLNQPGLRRFCTVQRCA